MYHIFLTLFIHAKTNKQFQLDLNSVFVLKIKMYNTFFVSHKMRDLVEKGRKIHAAACQLWTSA